MGLFDIFKGKKAADTTSIPETPESKPEINSPEADSPGWDTITSEFERIYPGQDNPKHYGTLISWTLGGKDPLDGISIYEYIYTGQTTGMDARQKSNITGFITVQEFYKKLGSDITDYGRAEIPV